MSRKSDQSQISPHNIHTMLGFYVCDLQGELSRYIIKFSQLDVKKFVENNEENLNVGHRKMQLRYIIQLLVEFVVVSLYSTGPRLISILSLIE